MYKGVGKMYVLTVYSQHDLCKDGDINLLMVWYRFIQQPRKTVDSENRGQEKSLSDDVTNLTKKVCYIYRFADKKLNKMTGKIPGKAIQRSEQPTKGHRQSLVLPAELD